MTPFWTLLLLGALFGAILTGFIVGIIWGIVVILRKLKPLVHLPDEEGGMGFFGRAKFQDGQIMVGKGDNVKRYPVNVSSRSVTNAGILYTLGRQTGANLRVPRVKTIRDFVEREGDGAVLMFDVADPGLLGRTYARRMAQETVDSQMEKEDWKKTAILPLSIILGITVVGLVIAAITFATHG